MSVIKDLILNDENLLEFLADKPVFEMLNENLTIEKIWSKILVLNSANKSEGKIKKIGEKSLEENFDYRIVLFERVLKEMVNMVKNCLRDTFSGVDENVKFEESLLKNIKVK